MKIDDTSKKAGADLPGSLQSKVVITLYTREARTLFAGRQQEGNKTGSKEYSINNLKKFAIKMNAIWFAAQDNDPFADWHLNLIEQQMEEASNLMSAEIAKLERLLDRSGLQKPMSAYSTEPDEVSLSFANPFSYRVAFLIGQYDKLACMALAACNGDPTSSEIRASFINAPARRIRRLFMMVTIWKPSGVTRQSYNPAKADTRKAEAVMGVLPKEYLVKSFRARISPNIRKTKSLAQLA